MFINIDYTKKKQKAKLHLAKPNKQIISHISEKFNDEMELKLGNINELNFSIPHYIEDEETLEQVRNNHVDLIKERMLIRVTLGTYKEWYIVDEIEEDGEDQDTFNVKAFSLGYELTGKRVSGLEEESINCSTLLTGLLEPTVWTIGEVDPIFDAMFRSFDSGSDSNVLDCILQAGETYGALIVWDTENRKVSFKDMSTNGRFRGMTVNYGRFLRSIKRTRTTDEMVTRMYVSGNEGLSIASVNPTGMNYLEDFSYFMYPFERDANKNVIKSSFFMSDALCHAILNQQSLQADNAFELNNLMDDLIAKQTELLTEQTELATLEGEQKTAEGLLDTAKGSLAKLEDQTSPTYASAVALVAQRQTELDNKIAQVVSQKNVIDIIEDTIESYQNQINTIYDEIYTGSGFTPQLLDELNLYVIEKLWSDDKYIDAKELYDDAVKKFQELRQPKVVIEVDIDNIMNIMEEQYYWDKLVLGDLIKVKYPQMNIEYMAKIIEIKYDLENSEASITIANTTDLLNDTEKLVKMLYGNSSASSVIASNKYKWDKINAVQQSVISLLTDEWDASKQKIIAGVNNSIEVGNRGIIITNPDFPDEMVIMQSGIMALSKDGGETWKTAIKPDGIVAERLIGKIIAGQELFITNDAGTFTMDNNGMRIKASSFVLESESGDANLLDGFINSANFIEEFTDDNIVTAYEKKMIKIEWGKILSKYDSNMARLNAFYPNDTSTAFISNYINAKQALYTYLFVTPMETKAMLADDNMAFSTRIDRTVFNAKFTAVFNAEAEVDEQLDIKTNELIKAAQESADTAQDNIDDVKDDIVYKTELHSSNGLVFRNGVINTVFTAKVYKGKTEITDTLPNSAFMWKKRDKNGNLDTAWNTAHSGVGKQITVTGADVFVSATFECHIDIP